MNVRGSRELDAPAAEVFAAICDPATLLAIIPGCRGIEQSGDEYRGRISLRLPGFAGVFRTTVRLVEADPPGYGRMAGQVSGSIGTVRGEASFRLEERDGRTTVRYDGEAAIDGPLAGLDNRFAEGLARSLIGQGLGNLETELRRRRSASDAADPPRATTETPA